MSALNKIQTEVRCYKCGEKMFYFGGTYYTLVGFRSPPGHNHDDNCAKRYYECPNDHSIIISKRRRCSNSECDWTGREECFCHKGKKVDEWPEEGVYIPFPLRLDEEKQNV